MDLMNERKKQELLVKLQEIRTQERVAYQAQLFKQGFAPTSPPAKKLDRLARRSLRKLTQALRINTLRVQELQAKLQKIKEN
jgi:hypothetical protein